MVCYLNLETSSSPISFENSKLRSELTSEPTQSFELQLGTRAIIELTRLKCI